MDIAALSMTNAQTSLQEQVSVAVLSKNLDAAKTMSRDIIKMMELSVNPQLGSNIDYTV